MRIENRTKGVVICENVREAKTIEEKRRGLINSDEKVGLSMQTRWGIHTFGMEFPIDVAILNKKNKVVKYKRALRPGQVFFWNPYYSRVVEIPTAILSEKMIQKGDELCMS